MAIANMSRYFWVDYYKDLILPKSASDTEKTMKSEEAAKRNKLICNTAFLCSYPSRTLPGESSFSLWTVYPGLMMGTGYPHDGDLTGDICAGFSFDYVTGLPYLPGSSVKGILRAAFEHPEYIRELINVKTEEVSELERVLFGERQEDAYQIPKDGKVTFLDAFPVKSSAPADSKKQCYKLLELEAITPHYSGELGLLSEPTPLTFLKLRPGVELLFRFICPKEVRYGDNNSIDAQAVNELFKNILLDLGAGAKTNVGFGGFTDKAVVKNHNAVSSGIVQPEPVAVAAGTCQQCGKQTKKDKNGVYYKYCFECNQKQTKQNKR